MSTKNTFLGAEKAALQLEKAERIALLGAGGVGMYSVARELLARGKTVIGSDRVTGPLFEDLLSRGARLQVGECPPGVDSCDLLIYTTAIAGDHPALTLSEQAGIPHILERAGQDPAVACGAVMLPEESP